MERDLSPIDKDSVAMSASRWQAFFLASLAANGDNETNVDDVVLGAKQIADAALEVFYKKFPQLKGVV